ncbi:MAG TPA: MBG domain-containing protein [Acidobacteriaceae bacterium]
MQTYTGSPLAVTATTTPVGLSTVSISYTGTAGTTYGPSTTAPTNVGTYAVTATLTNANYTGTQSGMLTINQATAAIALTNTVQTYTGSPLAVTATTTPVGLSTVSISYTGTGGTTYGPSTTAPTNVGTYAVTATLTNANYTGTQSGTLTINQATATIALTNTAQTYTGSPLAVTATTTPVGLSTVSISYTGTGSTTYGPSSAAPTNVGTYAVTATLTNANYTGTQNGTLTINQATATIALTNTVQIYTGSPLAVTATTTPVGLSTISINYTGTGGTTYGPSATAPTNVGSYAVTATLTNANYTGTQSGTLTINQATATIALTNTVQIYTGSPLAVTATTTPVGLSTVSISYTGTGSTTYGPSTTAPTNVGTYAVTATLTNANYTGTQSGTLTINQATATIALTNTVQIYTGSPLAVTATTTPVGLSTVSISYMGTGGTTYGPSTTAPTNVGTYAVTATLTNANYTGTQSGTLTINQATATIALTNTVQIYTGSPLAVTETTNPAGLTTVGISYMGTGSSSYGPSTTAPTNVGTYAVTATLTNSNYTGTQSGTLTINQATATIALTDTVQVYTGSPLAVTATTNPAGLTTVGISYTGTGGTTYGPSTAAPINVGTYAVTATLTNANYAGTQSGTLTINQATATIALTNTVQTYTGSPLAVTATTTPLGLSTVSISYTGTGSTTYGPSSIAPTNVGTYAVTATLTNANYTGTQSGTLTISQATATIGLTNTVQTYTGSPLGVTATTTPAGLSTVSISYTGTSSTTYGPSTTPPTNVGTYAVTATLTNANYTGTQSGTLTINQATATISLTNTVQTYTGSPLAVTATTTPVGLSTVSINYTGTGSTTYAPSTTAPTNVGTYAVTATLTNANYTGTQSGTLTINAASQTISFTPPVSSLTYGSATMETLTATGGSSNNPVVFTVNAGPGSVSGTNGSTLTISGAGTITINANQAASSNYDAAAQVQKSIIINKASSTLTGPFTQPVVVTDGQTANIPIAIAGQFSGTGISVPGGSIAYTILNSSSVTVASGTPALTSGAASVPVPDTLTPGNYTVAVSYAGDTNYNAATAINISLQIVQLTPAVTFAAPGASMVYGTSLGVAATATYNSATVPGAFTYTATPAGGSASPVTAASVLTAGTYTLTATFIPTDTVTYTNATKTASLTVTQFSPVITWPNPADITYGTPLGGTQLNATVAGIGGASITGAGTLVYLPALGAVLDAGAAQPLQVTFTPADTTNYTTASKAVAINVNAASQTISFTPPVPSLTYGSATTETLTAAGGASGNPVVFSIGSGPGSVSGANGSMLTITGAGTIAVNANQAANSNYAAAAQVQKSIVVNPASATLTGPATQPVFVINAQTGAIPVSIAGQFSGVGITPPSGSIAYSILNSSSAPVASGSLTITAGAVSVPVANTMAPGLYTVNASYAGDGNYAAATTITVNLQVGSLQPVATITAPGAPLTYGAALGISATATYNSATVPGTFVFTATPAGGSAFTVTAATVLPAGSYTLTANFTPTDTVTYKTATGTSALTVNKAAASIALTSSVNPILVQNATVFTATVSSAISSPTGTVTFYDNTALAVLGSNIPITARVAAFSISTLSVGTHSITAIYSGDTNFSPITSAGVSEQVDDFIFAISGSGGVTSQTIVPGATATYSFAISPSGAATFPASVTFTVSGLPAGATYTITPPTIAAGAGTTNVVLTITAPAQTALMHRSDEFGKRLAPLGLALLVLPFSGSLRRRAGKLGRVAAAFLLLISGFGAMAALTGCGTNTGVFGQQQKSYTVTITGTSGVLTHSTTVQLIVE